VKELAGHYYRLARKANLKIRYEGQIMTARQVHEWVVVKIPSPLGTVPSKTTAKELLRWKTGSGKFAHFWALRKHTVILASEIAVQTKASSDANVQYHTYRTLQD
jgi:hypothetical protein